MPGYLLGYDVGSSSVKAALIDAATGILLAADNSPKTELAIQAPRPGWAEQDPETWWEHLKRATAGLKAQSDIDFTEVEAVGISYQMHGLVLVDRQAVCLRPAIIWCDSRAVEIGNRAFQEIGRERCLTRLLNSPGNFTASKLKWVKENEPEIFERAYKAMLPGDYIAYKLTGEIQTTPSGLSEGILWDFLEQGRAEIVLEHYGIPASLIPDLTESFTVQGRLTRRAASDLGLAEGTPLSYRGGDQPNNALSLNVLEPGEIAATAGTSGVIYGVGDELGADPLSRVNTFVHVNNRPDRARYGTLLCINGTGILNSWLKQNVAGTGYDQMNKLAAGVPVGSGGLRILPFGNGAERTLGNKNIGAQVFGLNFNSHNRAHLLRAAQEGIVFAFKYGLQIMEEMGLKCSRVRAGKGNMFLSPVFCEAFATVTGAQVQLYDTDGAQGAARGAGVGAGVYRDFQEAFQTLKTSSTIDPDRSKEAAYQEAYAQWLILLERQLLL